jgi:hypothetical protein
VAAAAGEARVRRLSRRAGGRLFVPEDSGNGAATDPTRRRRSGAVIGEGGPRASATCSLIHPAPRVNR